MIRHPKCGREKSFAIAIAEKSDPLGHFFFAVTTWNLGINVKFYTVNDDYIKHLKAIDDKVRDNYGTARPYIGVLLEVNGHQYIAPLTSYKAKQDRLKSSSPTIFKMHEKGDENNKLGMVQLNNMIPVTTSVITLLDVAAQNQKYQNLLGLQLAFLKSNQDKITEKALKLYELITIKKHPVFCPISCDFVALEAGCVAFNQRNAA